MTSRCLLYVIGPFPCPCVCLCLCISYDYLLVSLIIAVHKPRLLTRLWFPDENFSFSWQCVVRDNCGRLRVDMVFYFCCRPICKITRFGEIVIDHPTSVLQRGRMPTAYSAMTLATDRSRTHDIVSRDPLFIPLTTFICIPSEITTGLGLQGTAKTESRISEGI